MKITGHTKLTGLLGSPVSHSISPLMHNEAFQLLGLDYAYLCFDVGEDSLADAVHGLRTLGARGWNCTMPDKQRMCELCDSLSPAAHMIGAVNTVVNENGILIGHNTDGVGYMMAVKEAGFDIIGKEMTLLGAGGASTAIAVQAALDGVKSLNIFNRRGRSWEHAVKLTDTINTNTSCRASLYDLADAASLEKCLRESAILTNGTSVGMAPHESECILSDDSLLRPELVVSDIIYNPRKTRLMQIAESKGCPAFNGLYMLLFQGAEAFRLWTGKKMPIEEIKHAYFTPSNF
ncbi:shikimate dehydrogenase [Lachnospiraceae bacterium 46-15]